MEKHAKFNFYHLILAFRGVLILQNLIFGQFKPRVIPYSEFLQATGKKRVINPKEKKIVVWQRRFKHQKRTFSFHHSDYKIIILGCGIGIHG